MPSTTGLILQHSPTGPPGLLGRWLEAHEIPYEVVSAWEETELPDPRGHRFVVALGSERSVGDGQIPWVRQEIELLRDSVEAGVPVLGLCFGGQALSVALDGGVDGLVKPEVGWFTLETRSEVFPAGPWLQYHNEVLRVPPGGQLLACSQAGPAAFSFGPHLGLQFHPEATGDILDEWARSDPDLDRAGVTARELAAQSARYGARARDAAFALFASWWHTGPGSASRVRSAINQP